MKVPVFVCCASRLMSVDACVDCHKRSVSKPTLSCVCVCARAYCRLSISAIALKYACTCMCVYVLAADWISLRSHLYTHVCVCMCVRACCRLYVTAIGIECTGWKPSSFRGWVILELGAMDSFGLQTALITCLAFSGVSPHMHAYPAHAWLWSWTVFYSWVVSV